MTDWKPGCGPHHELWCEHRPHRYRWFARDGCTGNVCFDCLQRVNAWPNPGHVNVYPLGLNELPVDSARMTFADALGHALAELPDKLREWAALDERGDAQ